MRLGITPPGGMPLPLNKASGATNVHDPPTTLGTRLPDLREHARPRSPEGVILFKVPKAIDEAGRVRMGRQDLTYHPDKKFPLVLTEAALRSRRCSTEVMLAQLDRLMSLSALPNMRLGIIADE